MRQFKQLQVETLLGNGVTPDTPDEDLRKQYFKVAGAPLSKANIADLREALRGNPEAILPTGQEKPKKEKAAKAPKEPKPVKAAETAEQALARLKADPATAQRWARVRSVDSMGKKGPTVVTIVCDDKGPAGEELTRQIKVQDLFQVKYSAGYAKKAARANRKKAAASTDAPAQQ